MIMKLVFFEKKIIIGHEDVVSGKSIVSFHNDFAQS